MSEERPVDNTRTNHDKDKGRYHVLIASPLIRDHIQQYDGIFEQYDLTYDIADVEQQLTEDELFDIIENYDGILAGDDELTERVLHEAGNLKVISKWGIGTDNIDKQAASKLGIEVFNTPGMMKESVADVVLGYSVMMMRQLHDIDRAVRGGNWQCPRGKRLKGKTFGIVGAGNIGTAVAHRAHAFGCDILVHDTRFDPNEMEDEIQFENVSLVKLLQKTDIVSLNCPLTSETKGLISHEEFRLLGKNGYIINTARGEIIDCPSLVEALKNNLIKGAALDVFPQEPLPSDSVLTELDNLILGSHNAGNTHESVVETNTQAVTNLLTGLNIDIDPTTEWPDINK